MESSAPALLRLLSLELEAAGLRPFLPEWQRRLMEASRADFERAARSTNLISPDPSFESLSSSGPRPEVQEGRDARYRFLCPDCGWEQTDFSSISNTRHHVRHQSCQRSGACTPRAVHCEVTWAESVSAPVNHVDLRVRGNNQEAQDGGSCRGRHQSGEFRHPQT